MRKVVYWVKWSSFFGYLQYTKES